MIAEENWYKNSHIDKMNRKFKKKYFLEKILNIIINIQSDARVPQPLCNLNLLKLGNPYTRFYAALALPFQ